MYGWIWRSLPGPFLAKAFQSLVLMAVIVAILFLWVFPWAESKLPYNDVTVPVPKPSVTATATATATAGTQPG